MESEAEHSGGWPAVDSGTTTSGLVGGAMTLLMAFGLGMLFRRRSQSAS